jgi:hypothetical protein
VRNPSELLGESPDRLTLPERERYVSWWIALEIYTPQTLPLRSIAALAKSSSECIHDLVERGLDPVQFEFVQLRPR